MNPTVTTAQRKAPRQFARGESFLGAGIVPLLLETLFWAALCAILTSFVIIAMCGRANAKETLRPGCWKTPTPNCVVQVVQALNTDASPEEQVRYYESGDIRPIARQLPSSRRRSIPSTSNRTYRKVWPSLPPSGSGMTTGGSVSRQAISAPRAGSFQRF